MFLKRKKSITSYHLKNLAISIIVENLFSKYSVKHFLNILAFVAAFFILFSESNKLYSQTTQSSYFAPVQPTNNFMTKSSAFSQEIARFEITVVRRGKAPLSITQVPRLQKDDVLKVHLLNEPVNGVKPDQGNWNWSFLVAFVNPGIKKEKLNSVSEEIQFRKSGWYKEYSFVVPYDSQPIFFLYPKPKYREKVLSLINKNSEEIRKIGEKTLDIAGAYAKIGSFLNELQYVINRNTYNNYGTTYSNPYGSSLGGFGTGFGTTAPTIPYNYNALVERSIERLASSFNIGLPSCWGGSTYGNTGSGFGTVGNYGNTYGSSFSSGLGSYGTNNYGYAVSQELIGRAQCVAKSIRLEDFDVSVAKMIQQGGIFGIMELRDKYPQLAYWINLTAAAIDFIIKAFGKSPLRVMPTLVSSSDNQSQTFSFQNNFSSLVAPSSQKGPPQPESIKISVFAESQPNDNEFVTAYPLVIHKWQANPDAEVINLPMPMLMEPCLHAGQNILRSTDLLTDWMSDTFTKDFQLEVSSTNGFRKQFPLTKNIGMSGWELNITKEDLNSFPKINMLIEASIKGRRGFNEVASPKFDLPIPIAGTWEVEPEAQKSFAVGAKRTVKLRNLVGNCRCLQAVIYKPSFGGQFIYEANAKENSLTFSTDGREVSFEVDATYFQPGQGQLELKQFGGETSSLPLNLYSIPPVVAGLKISKGDNRAVIIGEKLEQLRSIKINGNRAVTERSGSEGVASMTQLVAGNLNPPISAATTAPFNLANSADSNEKVFVFEDPNARLDSNFISLELELEGQRTYLYPKTFGVSPARPTIVADSKKEVDGHVVAGNLSNYAVNPSSLLVFPSETVELSLDLQNALTDYDFKTQNISIETRIEKNEVNPTDLPKAKFEVLDWKNMRVNFYLSESAQKLLSGSKIQFRICDRIRGNSDWYTVKQTFVRIPQTISVKCLKGLKGDCEITGQGIEYIGQVSLDGGKTWNAQASGTLPVQTDVSGQKFLSIPHVTNAKLLRIRLRDFLSGEGLAVKN